MPRIETIARDTRKPESCKLMAAARNEYSQFGEDGIVEAIFGIIEPRSRWCVELGAWDGVFISNTCNLIRNHGWKAVLIEALPERQSEIRRNHPDPARVHALCATVGFDRGVDTIDDLLATTPIPREFDVLSIDVDGIDWYLWESVVDYRPRLVIAEYNNSIPNDVLFVQERDISVNEGCSIAALVELAKAKGYELIAVTDTNAFFVAAGEFAAFDIADNSIAALRADPPNFVFSGYNGKIYNTLSGLKGPGRSLPFGPESLQFLSEFWYSGSRQYRDTPLAADLESAEGILREVFEIRLARKELQPDEFAARSKRAWAAAKAFLMQNRKFTAVK